MGRVGRCYQALFMPLTPVPCRVWQTMGQGLARHLNGIGQHPMRRQTQPAGPLLRNGLAQRLLNAHLLTQPLRLECIKLHKLVQDLLAIHINAPFPA